MPSISLSASLRGQLLTSGRFNPLSIFAANEPGLWYDPSDLTTMFVDRAGTTPVTAPGQSVGLRLDKSKGLAIGSELVTNGGFSAGSTGWSVGATWSISGGVATATSSTSGLITSAGILTVGKFYIVTYSIIAQTTAGSGVSVYVGGASGTIGTARSAVGTYTEILLCTTSTTLAFYGRGAGTWAGSIDNISVKEIAGNHAVANSDAARGIYGIEPFLGRRNLLTYTEQFDNAAWSKGANVTISSTSEIAPDGTPTAEKFSTSSASDLAASRIIQAPTTPSGSLVFSVWLRSSTSQTVRMKLYSSGGSVLAATLDVSVTSNWTRFQIAATGLTANVAGSIGPTGAAALAGIEVWGAQLELGSTATAYQKVVSEYEVTEAGVPTVHYVRYDGSDDGYVTPTITPGTDKVQVFMGVRKLSDAARAMVVELGGGVANAFRLEAPNTAGSAQYLFTSQGTAAASPSYTNASVAAPVTNVVTGLGDISGDRATLRVNGTQVSQSTADQGTGNYLAYPIYIGRRGGTTLPFNGRDYGIIVRFGANLTDGQIAATEAWMNSKTGAY